MKAFVDLILKVYEENYPQVRLFCNCMFKIYSGFDNQLPQNSQMGANLGTINRSSLDKKLGE